MSQGNFLRYLLKQLSIVFIFNIYVNFWAVITIVTTINWLWQVQYL